MYGFPQVVGTQMFELNFHLNPILFHFSREWPYLLKYISNRYYLVPVFCRLYRIFDFWLLTNMLNKNKWKDSGLPFAIYDWKNSPNPVTTQQIFIWKSNIFTPLSYNSNTPKYFLTLFWVKQLLTFFFLELIN